MLNNFNVGVADIAGPIRICFLQPCTGSELPSYNCFKTLASITNKALPLELAPIPGKLTPALVKVTQSFRCHGLIIFAELAKNYTRVMFKRDKSLFEQLVGRDAGQRPNIVSVPLKLGLLAAMVYMYYLTS